MLTMKRRHVLVCGAAASLPLSSTSMARAAARETMFVVYSQKLPRAQGFASQTVHSGNKVISLTGDIIQLWQRQISKHLGGIKGYTTWSDYVLLRGLAEEQGLRLRVEQQVIASPGKPMFIWIMS